MDFMKFLVEQGVIIAAGLYVFGVFLKKAPFMPDWLIPFILTVLGVAAAGFSMEGGFTVNNILQGIFAAGAAVLANQMHKQAATQDVGDGFADIAEQRPGEDEETDESGSDSKEETDENGSDGDEEGGE